MRASVGLLAFVVALAILVLCAFPCMAVEHKFIEDFMTTHYKDTLNTTAWWDTLNGELKLHPFVPSIVGSLDTPGYAWGIAIAGFHAYVADGATGLQVIDISDPENPVVVGNYNTAGSARGVAVDGDRAFVADGDSGLQIIDITNPSSPNLLGTYNTPGSAYGVAVSGSRVLVADNLSGLMIIDVSNPAAPVLLGSFDTPGMARGVAVSGFRAFVADYGNGLQVIDFSNPSSPSLVGTCDTPGSVCGVAVSGRYAYAADFGSGLQVVDISDPAHPVIVGSCGITGWAWGIEVFGDIAYVAVDYAGIAEIDISDPASPSLDRTIDTPGNALGVALSGTRAYVADYGAGLQVISTSNPTSPVLLGTSDAAVWCQSVAVSGNLAFVSGVQIGGFSVFDISDPTNLSLVGNCFVPNSVRRIQISGDLAFLAAGTSGVLIIDVSDPASPWIIGTYDSPGSVSDVTISGKYAYVADGGGAGLRIVNISNPASPVLVGTYLTPGAATGVAVSGKLVFVADWDAGLFIIDVSNPSAPSPVGICDTPGHANSVTVSGNYAYVTEEYYGLRVIDISNPSAPVLVGELDAGYAGNRIAVSGDKACLTGNAALYVIDISDPSSPLIAGYLPVYPYTYFSDLAVSGERAFVICCNAFYFDFCAVQVFDHEYEAESNTGTSLPMAQPSRMIAKARLVTSQTNRVTWELSADAGSNWQEITPDGNWNIMEIQGSDLQWRSTHFWAQKGINPTVTHIEIDWLYAEASIDSIVDVAQDQGGWVLLHFTRSSQDFSDETSLPVVSYGIWRRVDDPAILARFEAQALLMTDDKISESPAPACISLITLEGRTFIRPSAAAETSSFPPGTWVWVGTVPALQQETYIASIPTTADSSAAGLSPTVLVITAHTTTPSIWYVSAPDSGWSVDNIAPGVPTGLVVAYNTGSGNQLTWDPSTAEDFQYFRIYRGINPDFVPSLSNLVHSTAETSWSDPEYDGWSVYYKITALDYVGNESAPASPGTVTGTEEAQLSRAYALYPNMPNPFNPSTTIRYDVPVGGGVVTLRVYDVSGRLVRTLIDGRQAAGRKQVIWNGLDDQGRNVVSGVYFYRLQAPGYRKTLKMVLIR